MTKTHKDLIADIIDENAQINVEWGVDPYINNSDDIADLILKALEEKL